MKKEWIYITINNLTEFLKAKDIIIQEKISSDYVNISSTLEFKADIAHDIILDVTPDQYRYKTKYEPIMLTQGLMELLSNTPQYILKKYCGDSGIWAADGSLVNLNNRSVELI